MAKVKKGVAKRKARRKAAKRAARGDDDTGQSAAAAAVEYLQQWAAREQTHWKFVKSRQTFLLQKWPDRDKVTADTFRDLLLPYMQTLTAGCAQRTIQQARLHRCGQISLMGCESFFRLWPHRPVPFVFDLSTPWALEDPQAISASRSTGADRDRRSRVRSCRRCRGRCK